MKPDSKSNREIETEFLKIHGNCMEFNETAIQLSNISLLSTENISPEKLPLWTLAALVIGLALLTMKNTALVFVGLVAIAVGGYVIYQWYQAAQRAKEMKRLLIITNSGNLFSIVFQDRPFLERVVSILKEIISNPGHLSDVTINVKDNTFSGGASVIQEFNENHF